MLLNHEGKAILQYPVASHVDTGFKLLNQCNSWFYPQKEARGSFLDGNGDNKNVRSRVFKVYHGSEWLFGS